MFACYAGNKLEALRFHSRDCLRIVHVPGGCAIRIFHNSRDGSVHLGWVLFRAPTFERTVDVYRGLVGLGGFEAIKFTTYGSRGLGTLPGVLDVIGGPLGLLTILLPAAIAFGGIPSHAITRWDRPGWAGVAAVLGWLCLFSLSEETPFLYFQF